MAQPGTGAVMALALAVLCPSIVSSHSEGLASIPLAKASEGPIQIPQNDEQRELFGRFMVAQSGTTMCYRTWEKTKEIDFHLCNVCFNETLKSSNELSQDNYISKIESCFDNFLKQTSYNECLLKLRDPSAPNKVYDINVSEPPFDFSYRNFVRCAHGVTFKQEASVCLLDGEVIQREKFLEKFSCLLNNMIAQARRFSEANMKELVASTYIAVNRE